MASVADIEPRLLLAISQSAGPVESDAFAESIGAEHLAVVGCMKSLLMAEMITSEVPLSTVCCAPEERRAACRGRSMPARGATTRPLARVRRTCPTPGWCCRRRAGKRSTRARPRRASWQRYRPWAPRRASSGCAWPQGWRLSEARASLCTGALCRPQCVSGCGGPCAEAARRPGRLGPEPGDAAALGVGRKGRRKGARRRAGGGWRQQSGQEKGQGRRRPRHPPGAGRDLALRATPHACPHACPARSTRMSASAACAAPHAPPPGADGRTVRPQAAEAVDEPQQQLRAVAAGQARPRPAAARRPQPV